jgi:hypothetical protein
MIQFHRLAITLPGAVPTGNDFGNTNGQWHSSLQTKISILIVSGVMPEG